MIRNLLRFLSTPLGMIITVIFMMGAGTWFYHGVMQKNPGLVTAVHPKNEPLGGYASHSEFEQECSYCHAPVHCITDNRCQSCHIEIAQQRAEAVGLHGLLPGTSQCQTCHSDHDGRDVNITTFAFANIDHTQLASFSLANHQLDYEGSDMSCESCHQLGRFGTESLDCATCHQQNAPVYMADHTDQYGSDCLSCHDGHDRLANFDHNQVFPLDGQHADTACESCHIDHLFAGTSTTCAGCHQQPAEQEMSFGQACDRCHTTTTWLPAELRLHTFPLDHGADTVQTCDTCHKNRYTAYPCAACHEAADMETAHVEQAEDGFEDCLACHPTGQIEEMNEIRVNASGTISTNVMWGR